MWKIINLRFLTVSGWSNNRFISSALIGFSGIFYIIDVFNSFSLIGLNYKKKAWWSNRSHRERMFLLLSSFLKYLNFLRSITDFIKHIEPKLVDIFGRYFRTVKTISILLC